MITYDITTPPPASPTTLLATPRDWPRCTTYDCLDHGARMATGLSADGAPIYSCRECYASTPRTPRTPRPDTPPALTHHLQNAALPDGAFDSLLRAGQIKATGGEMERREAMDQAAADRFADERELSTGGF